jgi:hypothetical protein
MANTYKFDIVQVFTSDIELNSNKDELVEKIEFSLIGYRDNQNTFIIEDVDIPTSSGDIIPYNQLDKDIFVSWVINFVGEDRINKMKAKIDAKLEEMVNHFAQFDNIDQEKTIKSTLPPWVSLEIPEGAVVLTPKEIK